MAPKTKTKPKAKVPDVRPTLKDMAGDFTSEELTHAEQAIADASKEEKHKRRLEASMTYYLKQSGELNPGQRLTGLDRQQFLVLFLAKQAREKGSYVKSSTVDEVENLNIKDEKKIWMGKEQMEKKYGETRVKRWLEKDALEKRPDPVTGSEDDDMAEWAVPRDEVSWKGINRQKTGTQVDKDFNDKDKQDALKTHGDEVGDMVASMFPSLAVSSSGGEIKTEKDGEDALAIGDLLVMKDTKSQLFKIKNAEVEAKLLRDQAADVKYADALHADLKDIVGKLNSCSKAVEKLLLTKSQEGIVPTEVLRLDQKVKILLGKFDDMKVWGRKLGIGQAKKAKKSL